MIDKITIKGARTHNLKDINIELPKNKLIVVTGVSGSGKSSLAFDTIYAEGQRRYVESLSAYARQFLDLMEKPDVDHIEGLSPAISIDQKSASKNPRSTVGTTTEIYDYLRLFFARAGHPYCPNDGTRVEAQTIQEIVDSIIGKFEENTKLMVLAPIIKNRKGTYEELFTRLIGQGYVRVRVDGMIYSLEEDIKLDRYKAHNIEVVIDRLVLKKDDKTFLKRLTDSIELGINLAEGELLLAAKEGDEWNDHLYSEKYACKTCGFSFPEIEPHTFSFNSPYGACEKCDGLGRIQEIDPQLIYNPRLTISEGAIYPWSRSTETEDSWTMSILKSVAQEEGFSIRKPMGELSPGNIKLLLYGAGNKKYQINHKDHSITKTFEGVIPNLTRRYKETDSDYIRKEIEKYMRELVCPICDGKRLKKETLSITILGKNIDDVTSLSIEEAIEWINGIKNDSNHDDRLTEQELFISDKVIKEISARLEFLRAVGLNYLTLNRTSRTLSGGEAQRIRLASQIGSGLTGVLYILDEPSIGLHQRDNDRLLGTLMNLRDMGNTVIVVEHDEDTIRKADHIVDIGPGAGEFGGEIVETGDLPAILSNKNSLTGKYLSGEKKINKEVIKNALKKLKSNGYDSQPALPAGRRPITNSHKPKANSQSLIIHGAKQHNLKNIDVEFPLNKFICVTGVSGSGKSSLVNDILSKSLHAQINRAKAKPGKHDSIEGIENLDKVVTIDQSPIGRTPRSNPATYTGVFTPIRELFSKTKESKIRGYKPGRFSFNVKGGRCENCRGDGQIKIEMQFLPDVYVTCEVCKGKRYNREALQIDYKGKNIADVLEMTVTQALEFFKNIPSISNKLQTLHDVGLGYIRLGQSAVTLSGGEAQRVKLSTELSKRQTGSTFYILDEPTTGLHFEDIRKLLVILHSLVAKGNTVLVIEHNLDVIKTADWLIDLGPEGGDEGGEIIATGTPEEVSKVENSYTGQCLSKLTNLS